MKKVFCVICALLILALPCMAENRLSFSASNDLEELNSLNGQKVSIIGYMAVLSPISGKYLYLMNMPYQNCPFCVPNTQQLANTMAVYAPEGKTFDFTDQAVEVTGKLVVGDYEDEFGYTYNYRIVDADLRVVDLSELPEKYALWQVIAQDGIVAEVYAMFDYLHLVCQWQDYMFNYYDENDNYCSVNIYPGDVMNILEDDGPYGYAAEASADYFPDLITRARGLSETELEGLVAILSYCREISETALDSLYGGAFEYHEDGDYFTQNDYTELGDLWYGAWCDFSEWLDEWRM